MEQGASGTDDATSRTLAAGGLVDRGITERAGVVTRPAGPWTPTVHHLLHWLRTQGYDLAPRPLGASARQERLEYLPGRDQGWPFIADLVTTAGAFECGRFARGLREVLARYPCPPDAVWQSARGAPGPGEQVQHGDLGPWNLLWSPSGPQVCGVLDWDLAEPGDPWFDTAFLAWFVVPAMGDERAAERGFGAPVDRGERLAAFARGTGADGPDLARRILAAQQEFARRIVSRGGPGTSNPDAIWARLYGAGIHARVAEDMDYLRDHLLA
jgi:phosphotransferase family enzyme